MIIPLLLAAVAFAVTRQLSGSLLISLLVTVGVYAVARGRWGGGLRTSSAGQAVPVPSRSEPTGIEVRCELATPDMQRWVSPKTGRAFEVRPAQGVPGAEPGDPGVVVIRGGSVTVERPEIGHDAEA